MVGVPERYDAVAQALLAGVVGPGAYPVFMGTLQADYGALEAIGNAVAFVVMGTPVNVRAREAALERAP